MGKWVPDSYFIGKKFNMLTVVERAPDHITPSGGKSRRFKCLCDCGNELIVYRQNLGKTISCGCDKDLTGKTFGFFEVLCLADESEFKSNGRRTWKCKCKCGNIRVILGCELTSGRRKSCGCGLVKKERSKNKYKHMKGYYIGYDNKEKHFCIDENDYESVSKKYWMVDMSGHVFTSDYSNYERTDVYLHNYLMNPPDGYIVDHINTHRKFDCRRANMRIVTWKQNCMNHRLNSRNTSGVTGVCRNRILEKWNAQIGVNRKTIYLGTFDKFEDAVKARKEAEHKYFGEYSYDASQKIAKERAVI